MCRLLGIVSTNRRPLADLLPDSLPRFEALSAEHADGWGIGWVDDDGTLAVRKEAMRASVSTGFASTLAATETDAALLHLRQASPGMPLTQANTHPFLTDGWCFAHNGYAWPNAVLDTMMGEAAAPPATGDTDSERYLSLVRAELRSRLAPDALPIAARHITRQASITSLNCVMLTSDTLLAMAWWDSDGIRSQPDGETEDDYRLWFRVAADRVVVASAGIPGREFGWQELPNHSVLEVERGTLAARVHRLGRTDQFGTLQEDTWHPR